MYAVVGVTLVALLVYLVSSGRHEPPAGMSVAAGNRPQANGGSVSPAVTPASPALPATGSPVSDSAPQPVGASVPVTDPGAAQAVSQEPSADPPALEPEIRQALGRILNTSSEGLVEETRNGVTSVDLQRRFQTAPVATVDENGDVQITDYSHLPAETVVQTPP